MAGDAEAIQAAHGATVAARIGASLAGRDDFVNIGEEWFVKSLMADVNIGHLHLTEAILDMTDGGPLTTAEILPQLELDPGVDAQVQAFSLKMCIRDRSMSSRPATGCCRSSGWWPTASTIRRRRRCMTSCGGEDSCQCPVFSVQ